MSERVNGFDLEVTVENGDPRVRVSMGGRTIMDTDALSSTGLLNLTDVLKRASRLVSEGMERYWYAQEQQMRRSRSHVNGNASTTNE